MLHYRILRAINQAYPVVILMAYIAIFLLAFTLMFVYPPGALGLLWLGLIGLVFVLITTKLLAFVVHRMARGILGSGSCPVCGGTCEPRFAEPQEWRCPACSTAFLASGAEAAIQ